jgi:pyridoxal phosphate enzyme (YggS family)
MIDPDAVSARLKSVRARIAAAGGGADVSILAVTKGFGPDAVAAASACGCGAVGENYAQELIAKKDAFVDIDVHFIGQLQTNKVRQLAGLVSVYETVDRERLATEISRRHPGARVLIQVDPSERSSGESSKGGVSLGALDSLVEIVASTDLELRGLMTVGPTVGGPDAARAGFAAVRSAVDRLGLEVCSMGMTDDLEVAVQEGSTQVRVGTALFGSRVVPTWRDRVR